MKLYTDLVVKAARFVLDIEKTGGVFPTTPANGEFAFVDGVLYVWASVDGGAAAWTPLTNQRLHYTHTQVSAASTWTVNHNLDTKDVIVFVYDDADNLQFMNYEFNAGDPTNTIDVVLSEALAGRAVVFGASDKFAALAQGGGDGIDWSTPVDANIMPDVASTRDIGSEAVPFANIYVDDMHVGPQSLYVNGKKVLEDNADTITVTTDVDQDLLIKTTGVGDITMSAENRVVKTAAGGLETTVPATQNNKMMLFNNQSLGGNIQFTASGSNAQIQFNAADEIDLTAATIDINGDASISGELTVSDLNVTGTTTTVDTTNLEIQDNEIVLNNGETGAGVTAGAAGLRIDRGTENAARIYFDETDDKFKAEVQGGTTYVLGEAIDITGVDVAGNSKYYGTDESGTAGFYDLPTGGSGSGFTPVFKVDTDAAYTASANEFVIADTTAAAFSIALPATPTAGDMVKFFDSKKQFATNNLTVTRNGSNIEGVADDIQLNIDGEEYTFIFIDATTGWRLV